VRARVFHVTDDHLVQLVGHLTGRSALPAPSAEIVGFPAVNTQRGGAA